MSADLMDFEEDFAEPEPEATILDPGRLDPDDRNLMREEELRLSGMEQYKVNQYNITSCLLIYC